jgi:hypothetical protein
MDCAEIHIDYLTSPMQQINAMLLRLAQRAVREHSSHRVVTRRFVGRQAESVANFVAGILIKRCLWCEGASAPRKIPTPPGIISSSSQ